MTPEWPPLESDEVQIDGSDERCLRNVHPGWIESDGSLTSQVFRPTPKDEGKLSTARASKVSAADHYDDFTTMFKLDSAGVWSVKHSDVTDVELRWVDDHAVPGNAKPRGHAFLDFRHPRLTSGVIRRVGRDLAKRAADRGADFRPGTD